MVRLLASIAVVLSLAPQAMQAQTVSASRLLGAVVLASEEEQLGHITDLAIDLTDSRVRYAIVRAAPAASVGKVQGIALEALRPGLLRDRLLLVRELAPPPPNGNERMIRASTLIGREVRSERGEELGPIRDLAVDLDNGQVRYALLEPPGYRAREVPLESLHIPPLGGDAILK